MTAFSLVTPSGRYLIAGLLFLAVMVELALCFYQHTCHIGIKRRVAKIVLSLIALLALSYLTAAAGDEACPAPFPWLIVPLAAAMLFLHAYIGMRWTYRQSRNSLSPSSVKETLDNLNSGILFADASGRVILLNRTMGELAASLAGSYPQILADMTAALDKAERLHEAPSLYRFPDGRAWRFQTVPLNEPELEGFTQTTAQDMTELVETNRQLAEENAALRTAIEKIRRMIDLVADRVREQETLDIKVRVHNDIGKSLIVLSELMNGGAGAPDDELRTLHRVASLFAGDSPTLPGTLGEVKREAKEMRVTLILDGIIPQNKQVEALIAAAARECVTNCVRHAGGSIVTVKVSEHNGLYTVIITNDGEPPKSPIVEGGGLSSLRRSIEEAGGEMSISHVPAFALIINLMEKRPEQ